MATQTAPNAPKSIARLEFKIIDAYRSYKNAAPEEEVKDDQVPPDNEDMVPDLSDSDEEKVRTVKEHHYRQARRQNAAYGNWIKEQTRLYKME